MNKPTRPNLIITNGEQARALRKKLGQTQGEFWARASTSQSGVSRYESQGRGIPESVLILLHLSYGTAEEAGAMMAWLRQNQPRAMTSLTSTG